MSSSPTKPPFSLPTPWLSNDDRSDSLKKSGGHGAVDGVVESDKLAAGDTGGDDSQKTTRPASSYPIDENIFGTLPSQPSHHDGIVEEPEHEDTAAEEAIHPSDFKPFFTLIEDPETREQHHPTVHYIFSDDDPEILTAALLDTLNDAEDNSQSKQRLDEARERYVIVDMAADGKTVTSASSLSADWQALKTSIAHAPSWGENHSGADTGLMLQISGWQNGRSGALKDGKRRQEQLGNVDELIKIYGERLDRLNDVIGDE